MPQPYLFRVQMGILGFYGASKHNFRALIFKVQLVAGFILHTILKDPWTPTLEFLVVGLCLGGDKLAGTKDPTSQITVFQYVEASQMDF